MPQRSPDVLGDPDRAIKTTTSPTALESKESLGSAHNQPAPAASPKQTTNDEALPVVRPGSQGSVARMESECLLRVFELTTFASRAGAQPYLARCADAQSGGKMIDRVSFPWLASGSLGL